MTRERRFFTKEFKEEAVAMVESSDKTLAQIARDIGINDSSLRN